MRKFIKWKYLNSVTSLCKKIVVYNTCFRLPVIANQRAGFSGNPPDFPPSPHPSTQAVILSERSESKDLRTERS